MLEDLLSFVQRDYVIRYLTTLFGAVMMYVFSLNKGFTGAIDFLRRFFPGRSEVFYDRADFILVVVSGSIIATIFYSPDSNLEGLTAGFGWVAALNILLASQRA